MISLLLILPKVIYYLLAISLFINIFTKMYFIAWKLLLLFNKIC